MREDGIVDRISFYSSRRDCVGKIYYSGFGGIRPAFSEYRT